MIYGERAFDRGRSLAQAPLLAARILLTCGLNVYDVGLGSSEAMTAQELSYGPVHAGTCLPSTICSLIWDGICVCITTFH